MQLLALSAFTLFCVSIAIIHLQVNLILQSPSRGFSSLDAVQLNMHGEKGPFGAVLFLPPLAVVTLPQ